MPIIPDLSYNSNRAYYGKTQYQYYCDFINGILKNIRRGEVDYCFYVYQIEELLKYEHDNLCAKYLDDDECFQVSLKTSR